MKHIVKYALISIAFLIILLLVFSCGLNSAYLISSGLDEGNKNFRESFLKVESKFSTHPVNATRGLLCWVWCSGIWSLG